MLPRHDSLDGRRWTDILGNLAMALMRAILGPDISPLGLAVSPSFQNNYNLGQVEETRLQPPIRFAQLPFEPRIFTMRLEDRAGH